MSSPSPTSPKRRPRLSLQIKAISSSSSVRNSRTLAAAVDVKDHTTFNTLTNVYATAIDRSTPVKEKNETWGAALAGVRPSLHLRTQLHDNTVKEVRSPAAYRGPYLDTPSSAHPKSPSTGKPFTFPSAVGMTCTPPLSAGPTEPGTAVFTFDSTTAAADVSDRPPPTPRSAKRRSTMPNKMLAPPYSHPRALHSILRNSPLPPLSTRSPVSPRRQSVRLQERAARRVAYNSPLCQTITTTKYTRSHIDLLSDDASPCTPASEAEGLVAMVDTAMAYTGDETRDGGQTPGPFEEMRRRIAGLKASSPLSPTGGGIRKKGKKKEKKRRWVWTIGETAGDEQLESPEVVKQSALQQLPSAAPSLSMPTPGRTTRAQAAAAAIASAAASSTPIVTASVPVIAIPVPRRARSIPNLTPSLTTPTISIPAIAAPLPSLSMTASSVTVSMAEAVTPFPRPQRRATLEVPVVQAPLSPVPRMIEELPGTPPTTADMLEPPTPSVNSVMTQDSVFSVPADVEMSDTASFLSMDDFDMRKRVVVAEDEMDMDTPTATQNPLIVV